MNIFNKIAAVLALFLGLMSVLAGSMVLLGIDTKEYNILTWLVSYNVIFGVISIFAAYLIWRENKKSKYLNLFILAMHFMVFFILRFFSSNVASESIKAMVFRTSIWVLIILLSLIVPIFINKQQK
jgi:fucose 4-O-acetylase-like acetyltransferase